MKKYFIIAGEPSGDLYGGNLIRSLKEINPDTSFMGHGGDSMQKEGMKIIEHVDSLSIMGFYEVLKEIPRMWLIMKKTISLIKKSKPHRIILIDYPGFNLRLAKNIHHLKIPITYFILPQVWAWKKNRIKIIKSYVDQSISIFPFEKQWFENNGISVEFFGHPLADEKHVNESTKEFFRRHSLDITKPIIALLPGSRQQEINRHMNIFIDTIKLLKKEIKDIQVIIGKSPNVKLPKLPEFYKIEENSKKTMIVSTAAIVASGTATLECVFEQTPLVVCYKLSNLSWWLIRRLVHVKHSSIINIIEDRALVPECIQEDMNPKNILEKLLPLLDDKSEDRNDMISDFNKIKRALGDPGVYKRIAEAITKR